VKTQNIDEITYFRVVFESIYQVRCVATQTNRRGESKHARETLRFTLYDFVETLNFTLHAGLKTIKQNFLILKKAELRFP